MCGSCRFRFRQSSHHLIEAAAAGGAFSNSLLTPAPSRRTLCPNHLPKEGVRSFRECRMYRPPLRGRPVFAGKKVLLIDRCQPTREARAAVLRTPGVEVHEAEEIPAARFLWQPNVYHLLMLDLPRYSPDEALALYGEVMHRSPHERLLFLTGPPTYLSRALPSAAAIVADSHGH